MVASGHYDVVLGSRILGGETLSGGMPLYKYIANRFLTLVENLALGVKLSEFHTGYRAFSRRVLEILPLGKNSDNFVFDNEMLAQAVYFGFKIGEISCPTKYFREASIQDRGDQLPNKIFSGSLLDQFFKKRDLRFGRTWYVITVYTPKNQLVEIWNFYAEAEITGG
jgi:hypothetical protein